MRFVLYIDCDGPEFADQPLQEVAKILLSTSHVLRTDSGALLYRELPLFGRTAQRIGQAHFQDPPRQPSDVP